MYKPANPVIENTFLKQYFSSIKDLKKVKLPGDGGHRLYTRIYVKEKSFILMSCGKRDKSLKAFLNIQRRLSPFVSVPEIFHVHREEGLMLLEDLGEKSLEVLFFKEEQADYLSSYFKSLKELIGFQMQVQTLNSDPVFDTNFFLRENEIALQNMQTYIQSFSKGTVFNKTYSLKFKEDMSKLLLNFKTKDYVYCHRDYHSRNLMFKNGKLVIIDFQDAGIGPWYYDLSSLLYDSYTVLTDQDKKTLINFYYENLSDQLKKQVLNNSHIEFMVKLQFLQRGFKACGCFAAFYNRDKKSSHLKYIVPTLRSLEHSAYELSYFGIYDYIKQLKEILEIQAKK